MDSVPSSKPGESNEERAFTVVGRRRLLGVALAGVAGIATAALIGCGDDDDDDDDDAAGTTPAAGTSTPASVETPDPSPTASPVASPVASPAAAEEEYLNEDLLTLNDPELPFPYVFPEPNVPAKKGGVHHTAISWSIDSFDTAVSSGTNWVIGPNATTEPLLRFVANARLNPFKIQLAPSLAESWEVTPDGLTLSFQLASKATYHNVPPVDGRPFIAEDARINYDRYRTEGVHVTKLQTISSAVAVDEHTFALELHSPAPDLLTDTGTRNLLMHPHELFEDENLLEKGVSIGTGAFILDKYDPQGLTSFVRNPDYYKHEVYLDGAEFQFVTDPAAQVGAMRVGQIDYLSLRSLQETQALQKSNPEFNFSMAPVVNASWMFGFNLRDPKFQDERVRQAMMLGLDRAAIEEIGFSGLGKSLPGMPWFMVFDQEPTPTSGELGPWFRYDPDEAMKLLNAAGATGLSIDIVILGFIANLLSLAADNFRDIGVELNATTLDSTAFQGQYLKKEYKETIFGYLPGGSFGPDHYFHNHLKSSSPGNWWNIDDPDLDEWGAQQQTETDPERRRETLRKIWDRMLEKAYRVDFPGGPSFHAYQPYLRNLHWKGPLNSVTTLADEGSFLGPVWLDK